MIIGLSPTLVNPLANTRKHTHTIQWCMFSGLAPEVSILLICKSSTIWIDGIQDKINFLNDFLDTKGYDAFAEDINICWCYIYCYVFNICSWQSNTIHSVSVWMLSFHHSHSFIKSVCGYFFCMKDPGEEDR